MTTSGIRGRQRETKTRGKAAKEEPLAGALSVDGKTARGATATELELDRLVFLLDGKSQEPLPLPREFQSDPQYEREQGEFRSQLQREAAITVEWVRSPDELKAALTQALGQRPGPSGTPAEQQSAVGPQPTWPVVAGAPQNEEEKVLEALQHSARVIEQVEHGYAKPAGMDAWDAPSAQPPMAEDDVRYIEVEGKAAAGPRTMSTGADFGPLAVPSARVRGSRFVAVQVQGDSMIGVACLTATT